MTASLPSPRATAAPVPSLATDRPSAPVTAHRPTTMPGGSSADFGGSDAPSLGIQAEKPSSPRHTRSQHGIVKPKQFTDGTV